MVSPNMRYLCLATAATLSALPLSALPLSALPLSAQTDARISAAAETITAAAVARHIQVIADDSMLGRGDTAGHGLAMTARYVADQLAAFRLTPPEPNNWLQVYALTPLQLPLDYATSRVEFSTVVMRRGMTVVTEEKRPLVKRVSAELSSAAYVAPEVGPRPLPRRSMYGDPPNDSLEVRLVTGRHTAASLQRAELSGTAVLYVPPAGLDSVSRRQVIEQLYTLSSGVVVLSDKDSANFAHQVHTAQQQPRWLLDDTRVSSWAVHVWPGALQEFLAAAGLNMAQLRADSRPAVRELPGMKVLLNVQPPPGLGSSLRPNTVGILEGSDSVLKYQYLVLSAHMDHTAIPRGPTDRLSNGADDNASGTAGLIELARAFSQPGVRPRRSVIFVALSGTEEGLQGARSFLKYSPGSANGRTITSEQMVANLNLDMLGRKAGDSVLVDGMGDLVRIVRPDWLAAQHPELQLTVVDGGTVASTTSDHAAFVARAVPSLHFHKGTHEDAYSPTDSPQAIDSEHEARILRLIFYTAQQIANAERRPGWSADSRQARAMLHRYSRE